MDIYLQMSTHSRLKEQSGAMFKYSRELYLETKLLIKTCVIMMTK